MSGSRPFHRWNPNPWEGTRAEAAFLFQNEMHRTEVAERFGEEFAVFADSLSPDEIDAVAREKCWIYLDMQIGYFLDIPRDPYPPLEASIPQRVLFTGWTEGEKPVAMREAMIFRRGDPRVAPAFRHWLVACHEPLEELLNQFDLHPLLQTETERSPYD